METIIALLLYLQATYGGACVVYSDLAAWNTFRQDHMMYIGSIYSKNESGKLETTHFFTTKTYDI